VYPNDRVIMELQCIVTKNRMSQTTHCFVEIYPDWFSHARYMNKSDKHSPQKINTKYLLYNIVMLYWRYLVFIFCSVNELCLKFMHCFTY